MYPKKLTSYKTAFFLSANHRWFFHDGTKTILQQRLNSFYRSVEILSIPSAGQGTRSRSYVHGNRHGIVLQSLTRQKKAGDQTGW
jgi:hypothetical protein